MDSETLARACGADGEFRLAARHWTGSVVFCRPKGDSALRLENGRVVAPNAQECQDRDSIQLIALDDVWEDLLSEKPARFCNDIANLIGLGRMKLEGDRVRYAQYYPAIMRAIELMRPRATTPPVEENKSGEFDSPVGRYVRLDIGGKDHRIYFEETGSGIPLLLQHTAGCHGVQWRHLFECREITDRFRLIAYDLPYHGKSLPPVGSTWWASEYKLDGAFLRSIPVALAKILKLDRPVFMGCSVGGLLALDLALRHADLFSAVIAVEGALKVETEIESLSALWHPQVSNEYKARLMNALMSPSSPEAYRKETSHVYAAGWPPAFLGDLFYYLVDFDLREAAAQIDTSKVSVHILSGEYDASATLEHGKAAHEAIRDSSWTMMKDIGHFPMSENPQAFIRYLLPILTQVEKNRTTRR